MRTSAIIAYTLSVVAGFASAMPHVTPAPTHPAPAPTDCPYSSTVTLNNQFRCPRIQCIGHPACPDIVIEKEVPCSCQRLPPTTTTIPYPCPDCKCVIPTVTRTDSCPPTHKPTKSYYN